MTRLLNVDTENCHWLQNGDDCKYLGEYVSHGNWNAGETNRQILNLKKKPSTSNAYELQYKQRAVRYWANRLLPSLNIDLCVEQVTFIPMPCSKPVGHPDFDNRMVEVLRAVDPQFDVRCVIEQTVFRDSQHEGQRLTPRQLAETMRLAEQEIVRLPVKRFVIVVDDVITLGASFKAAQQMLLSHQAFTDKVISGLFLARTVWLDDDVDWNDAF